MKSIGASFFASLVLALASPLAAQESPAAPSTSDATDPTTTSEPREPTEPPASADPLTEVRRLVYDEVEFEQASAELARVREAQVEWSRAQLTEALELEAYVAFGLGNEARWTQSLLELATLEPGHALPNSFPLPLVRLLAEFSANARSLVLSLDVQAQPDQVEAHVTLLHDVGQLSRSLMLRARRVGDGSEGWNAVPLEDGAAQWQATAGTELELEAIAFGPQRVEIARSGVEFVVVPRHIEIWEEWPFWTVLGLVAAASGAVIGVSVWAADRPPELTLGMPTWCMPGASCE